MSEDLVLKLGKTYRAKKPCRAGKSLTGFANDRTILWMSIGGSQIQYDGPSVSIGSRQPIVSKEAFLAWADRDVTDELPAGEYAPWPLKKAVRS